MGLPPKRPFLVGITGGIGAGKSIVSKVFEVLGVPVYFADQKASLLMDSDPVLQTELIREFGEDAVNDGKANKEFFRKLVFNDEGQRKKLNAIVHPAVGKDFEIWVQGHAELPYLLKEAALLIEAGSYKELDVLIGVFAPKEERVKRVLKRDPYRSETDVRNIMDKQMEESEMRGYCQVQIENDGRKPVLEEILNFHKSLTDHLVQKEAPA